MSETVCAMMVRYIVGDGESASPFPYLSSGYPGGKAPPPAPTDWTNAGGEPGEAVCPYLWFGCYTVEYEMDAGLRVCNARQADERREEALNRAYSRGMGGEGLRETLRSLACDEATDEELARAFKDGERVLEEMAAEKEAYQSSLEARSSRSRSGHPGGHRKFRREMFDDYFPGMSSKVHRHPR